MKRLLLDTNIYGERVIDKELPILTKKVMQANDFVIYGFAIIRKELRNTPSTKKLLTHNLRVALLSLYDQFVKDHLLNVNNEELLLVAQKYYFYYQQLGGITSFQELEKDYLIVACASLKGMDIVVSDDDASMLSELSIKVYKQINEQLKLRTPEFLDYSDFRGLVFK